MTEQREVKDGDYGIFLIPRGNFWTGKTWWWMFCHYHEGGWCKIAEGERAFRRHAIKDVAKVVEEVKRNGSP